MAKKIAATPTGSLVVWHIQRRLREKGYDIAVDGDLGPKTFWDSSETLNAILKELGGPVAEPKKLVNKPSATGKRVFIDVGHGRKPGSFDPGAVHSSSQITEHSLNVIGANALARRLREHGIEATVGDESLSNYDAGRAAKGHDIFVSFHHNAAVNAAQYSLALFGSRNTTESDKKLAALASKRVAEVLGITDKGAREMSLSVLSGARSVGVPTAILVEPYFIHKQTPDKPAPAHMPDWSARAGVAIADAIAEHIGG